MMTHLKYWLKGLAVAATSMIVYAVALGCYIALMLLVISMEEGGDNLSALSVPLTEAVVLLSQGIGFQAGAITLTILPLLLTVLLIALIASFATRFGTDIRGFVSGLVFWELMNVFFAHSVEVTLLDQLPGVMWKSALVFIVGYAVAAIPRSKLTSTLLEKVRTHVSAPVRRTLSIGTGLGMLLTGIYLIAGLVAVLYWCFANQSAVVKLYELSGMQTGSRILTTVAVIAWLPNVMIWAVSWLFGSGFAIGDLASFTMWSGQGSALPGLPAFGILPQAVSTPWIRIALLCIPFVTGLLAGLAVMLFDRGFAVRINKPDQPIDVSRLIAGFAYPAGAFCIASALVAVLSSMLFALSNGALGTKHLAHIGMQVIASTRKVGQPTALGLFSAWLIILVGMAAVFGIRWLIRRVREARGASSEPNTIKRESTVIPRTVNSTINNKEEQGDNNESTDTTGSGIRLP
ncbi:DUF6350 family protein [Bifidobacterium sp.]|uniref:cell division protein PerM n=1 Tax=Bifidobacterium sp. TaxID=41200 RepID=UPI00290E480F|nr:DUF6350 family protein [Bifidobacterium sp.]MDU5132491.1 DUF6350 family protein [Bifidobacterium sp.]